MYVLCVRVCVLKVYRLVKVFNFNTNLNGDFLCLVTILVLIVIFS